MNSGAGGSTEQRTLLQWQNALELRARERYHRGDLQGALQLLAGLDAAHNSDGTAIGDSLRDMQAAAAAGCAPHLVCTGRHADLLGQTEAPAAFPAGTRVHANLAACVDHLLKASVAT